MEKKTKLKWKPVALDQAVLSKGSIEGLIGIEELTDYSFEKSSGGKLLTVKTVKKNGKINKKRKLSVTTEKQPKNKRSKLVNSNTLPSEVHLKTTKVDGSNSISKPKKKRKESESNNSLTSQHTPKKKRKQTEKSGFKVVEFKQNKKILKSGKKSANAKKKKSFTSVVETSDDNESLDESKLISVMSSWNELFVPTSILKALYEIGFKEPTQIQALSLPPAIMGRKDIMGAAETGSGKTLAFGIPILAGIMKAKEVSRDSTEEQEDNPVSGENDVEEAEEIETVDMNDDSVEENESVQEESDSPPEEGEEDASDNIIKGGNIDSEEYDDVAEDSDEEEDNVVNENIENEMSCIRVINNVKFPFPVVEVKKINRLWALILTPTRELAIQVYKHLMAAAKYTGIKIAVLVGGMAQQKQERMLRRCPEIVVATPGRLWELIQDGNAHLSGVDQIRFLAVDEADRMMEAGHFQELKDLLERINKEGNKHRQNFVFSATLSLVHEGSKRKKGKFKRKQTPGQKLHSLAELIGLKDPKIVDVTPEGATAGGLVETRLTSSSLLDRDVRLASLLTYLAHSPFSSDVGSSNKTIVFCNSVGGVRRLAGLLSALQLSPVTLHAGMQQRQRLRSLENFSKGGILLATDVAARGLDLPLVDHVVHFQVPRTAETYVHRSGRTARAQREGLSVLLVEPKEVPFYNRLCRTLGKDDGLPLFPLDEQLVKNVKGRVRLARDVDFLEHQLRRSGAEGNWLRKTVEEADILLDEDYLPKKYDVDSDVLRKELNGKKKELNALLRKRILPMGFSPRYPTMNGGLKLPKIGIEDDSNNAAHLVKSILNEKEQNNKMKKRKKRNAL